MTRLNWDKAAARDRVARQGGDRVRSGAAGGRAVYASDRQVEELRRLGYEGRRPETAAMARAIRKTVKQLGVTLDDIEATKRLMPEARSRRVEVLRGRLAEGYREARAALHGTADKRLFSYLDLTHSSLSKQLDDLKKEG